MSDISDFERGISPSIRCLVVLRVRGKLNLLSGAQTQGSSGVCSGGRRIGLELLWERMAARSCRSSSQTQKLLGVGISSLRNRFEIGMGISTTWCQERKLDYRPPLTLHPELPPLIKKQKTLFCFHICGSLSDILGNPKSDYWQVFNILSHIGFFRGINLNPKVIVWILVMHCSRIRFAWCLSNRKLSCRFWMERVKAEVPLLGMLGTAGNLSPESPLKSYFLKFFLSFPLLSFTHEEKFHLRLSQVK